jgi:hypothetical protein
VGLRDTLTRVDGAYEAYGVLKREVMSKVPDFYHRAYAWLTLPANEPPPWAKLPGGVNDLELSNAERAHSDLLLDADKAR